MRPWLTWRATHLVVSDLRIMFRSGIVHRRGIDIPLRRINSVQYHQGLIDRLLRCGLASIDAMRDRRAVHRVEVIGGVLEAESGELLRGFFDDRR